MGSQITSATTQLSFPSPVRNLSAMGGESCALLQNQTDTACHHSSGFNEAWLTQKPDSIFPGAKKACPLVCDSVQRESLQDLMEAAVLVQKRRQQAAVILDFADELQITQQREQRRLTLIYTLQVQHR